MRTNLSRQHEEAFTILRTSLGRLNLPVDLVDELIDRHIAVSFEKGAMAFCEGNTDGMLACILSGYVYIYCPVGDGNRTLVRMAGPGEIIGYPDYIDEKGRHADPLVSIVAPLNPFGSETPRRFTILLNLPFWDRLTMVMTDLAKRAGVRDSEGIMLIPEIGHEDLAEMIGCSRPMVSRLIAIMAESGLLARRGKQYVLLKKWDFNNNHKSQKQVRLSEVAASPRKPLTSPAPAGSPNGSGSSRGIAAYAARSSG